MKVTKAIPLIKEFDEKGKYVFNKKDLLKLFPNENPKSLEASLTRLVKAGVLERACRGVFVNKNAHSFDAYTLEHIAKILRRGHYNYVSLESMLSEYGLISQIPLDRITIMTTGRSGTYKTPYGVIEFTHTKRPVMNILENTTTVPNRPLRVATPEAALRDLKRVGRNLNLLIQEATNHE